MNWNYRNMPGPGDEATWGPCTGHPGDPRTPDHEDDEDEVPTTTPEGDEDE